MRRLVLPFGLDILRRWSTAIFNPTRLNTPLFSRTSYRSSDPQTWSPSAVSADTLTDLTHCSGDQYCWKIYSKFMYLLLAFCSHCKVFTLDLCLCPIYLAYIFRFIFVLHIYFHIYIHVCNHVHRQVAVMHII